ncbi:MAG: hypothetical protein LUO89_13995 [Methanothrix sp.]|nr:hypothetical protein [Methanothrix sp.]
MMCRRLLLSVAMLLCLTALLFSLFTPALCGPYCGSNPLGDTSGDTDFYVSKNQNQGSSSSGAATTTGTGAAVKALGASAAKVSLIQSLTADKPGPQTAGAAITWTANLNDNGQGAVLYDFWLKGPSTGGQLMEKTGWTAANTWTWNTSEADAGENQIEVRAKYASSTDFDDSRAENYVVASATAPAAQNEVTTAAVTTSAATTSDVNPRPASKTADSMMSKPRYAPDERPKAAATPSSGPNMSMPEPNPKPPAGAETAATQVVETTTEPETAKIMDMGGKWSVKLQDMADSLDLILIQSGETLMGSGTLNDKGTKIPVTAKGDVSGNSMSLKVATVVGEYVNQIDKSFNLELVKVDRKVSGSYEAYSGEDMTGKGNATASGYGA